MVSCHRSETPLIYKAVPSWFVRVQHAQEKLLENNKKTYWWVPVLSDWSGKVSEVIDGFSVLFDGAFGIGCFEQPGCYCLVGANAECGLTTAAYLHVITSHNMCSLLWSDMLLVKHFPVVFWVWKWLLFLIYCCLLENSYFELLEHNHAVERISVFCVN